VSLQAQGTLEYTASNGKPCFIVQMRVNTQTLHTNKASRYFVTLVTFLAFTNITLRCYTADNAPTRGAEGLEQTRVIQVRNGT